MASRSRMDPTPANRNSNMFAMSSTVQSALLARSVRSRRRRRLWWWRWWFLWRGCWRTDGWMNPATFSILPSRLLRQRRSWGCTSIHAQIRFRDAARGQHSAACACRTHKTQPTSNREQGYCSRQPFWNRPTLFYIISVSFPSSPEMGSHTHTHTCTLVQHMAIC